MRLPAAIIAFAVFGFVVPDVAVAETLRFSAALTSQVTVPPRPSSGQGNAVLSLDTASRVVGWIIEYSGLPGPAKAVGCGALDASGGPAILATSNLVSPVRGSKALSDAEIAELKAGNWACVIDSGGEQDEIGGTLQP